MKRLASRLPTAPPIGKQNTLLGADMNQQWLVATGGAGSVTVWEIAK